MHYRHLYSTATIQAALLQEPPETDHPHRCAAKRYFQRARYLNHPLRTLRLALEHSTAILLPSIQDSIMTQRIRYKLDENYRSNGEEMYELAAASVLQSNYPYTISKLNIAATYYRRIHHRTLFDTEMLIKIELIIAYCFFQLPTPTNFHLCFMGVHLDTAQALSYLVPGWRSARHNSLQQAQADYLIHLISRNLYWRATVNRFIAVVNDYIVHPERAVSVYMNRSFFATPFSSLIYHEEAQPTRFCRIS